MASKHPWIERILPLLLVSSLAACDPGSQSGTAQTGTGGEDAAMEDRFANMFVDEVSTSFNPGLQIGDRFPAIRAYYQGVEITSIDRFIRDKGAIFMANRSVEW